MLGEGIEWNFYCNMVSGLAKNEPLPIIDLWGDGDGDGLNP